MDYTFHPWLESLGTNWFEDDPLLVRLLAAYAPTASALPAGAPADEGAADVRAAEGEADATGIPQDLHAQLTAWGARVAGPLRELAERSAQPENRPRLRHWDAFGRRVDEIVLPEATRQALAEVEGREGLGVPHGDPFVFYARTYLCWQNGEAGVACSMGCTDGLIRVLEALGHRKEHTEAVERVRGSSPDRVWHGAQFVTEIQGGSDVPANVVRAEPDGDRFRIHGRKWFCSNVNADYFLVTARPEGAPEGGEGLGLFLVPAYLEGEAPLRNGYTIDRLKEKLGTRELATAEVTFRGALAVPVGPLDRGLPNLLRYVLVPSRFACAVSAAAFLRRAERIVEAYAGFRRVFGRPLIDYPLVRKTVGEIGGARARALAVVFELLRLWEGSGEERAQDFRILLSLAKSVLTREATSHLHEAMAVLGGNGIEESFSPLPRLYRDSVIMETWEGPHNVLLAQALRDLVRFQVDPEAFVTRVAGPGRRELVRELSEILETSHDPEASLRLPAFASALIRGCGERVLEEVKMGGVQSLEG